MKDVRRMLPALALLLAACADENPAGLDPEGGAPEVAAAQAGGAGVGARFDPARFRFYNIRYYEGAGEVLHCQAVPPPAIPVSDFIRTFPNGDAQIHMSGIDAYVLVSRAPAALDEEGKLILPDPADLEARWAGRGRLSITQWHGTDGLYSINGTVDAVVGPADEVGLTHGRVDHLVATHAAAFDAAVEEGSELRRVRCRLHWTTFVGKLHSNEITLEPLPGGRAGRP